MIEGVKIIHRNSHKDKRGFFMEVLRTDEKSLSRLRQISISLTKPGVIKAFHWHKHQNDAFFLLKGTVVVALYDLRKNSKTKGMKSVTKLSEKKQEVLIIPKGVAHGYKVVGNIPALMLYIMDKEYSKRNPDEQRIDPFDVTIGIDWDRFI